MDSSQTTEERPSKDKPQERDSKRKGKLVSIYTGFFSVLGIGLLVYATLNLPKDLLGLLVFTISVIVTEIFSVELYSFTRGSRVSVTSIISIAGIVIFGPTAGTILGATAGVTTELKNLFQSDQGSRSDRTPRLRVIFFNVGMFVVSTTAAGHVYVLTGGEVGNPLQFSNFLPIVAAVTVNELLNILILLGVLTIQTGQSPIQIWRQMFEWGIPIGIVSGVIGSGALAIAYDMLNVVGFLVFLLPVIATSYAFRLYVNHTRQYVDQLEEVNRNLEEVNRSLDDANLGLLETLGAVIDAYDVYTYGHSAQIALYVEAIAEKLMLSPEDKSVIVKAALVHDIGKVGVTDAIVAKQGKLSDEEYQILQRHPIVGADIIRRMNGMQSLVPCVRYHHEHWDGTGYPAGLAAEEIPLGARIIALSDAVDAMLSHRPYRKARDLAEVKQEVLRFSGTQFDPLVVEAFLKVAEERGEELFKDSSIAVEKIAVEGEALIIGSISEGLRFLKRSMISGG
jgi:putative nucleotidyltransferase with HDIG domain